MRKKRKRLGKSIIALVLAVSVTFSNVAPSMSSFASEIATEESGTTTTVGESETEVSTEIVTTEETTEASTEDASTTEATTEENTEATTEAPTDEELNELANTPLVQSGNMIAPDEIVSEEEEIVGSPMGGGYTSALMGYPGHPTAGVNGNDWGMLAMGDGNTWTLAFCLQKGVAAHNGDTYSGYDAVEDYFADRTMQRKISVAIGVGRGSGITTSGYSDAARQELYNIGIQTWCYYYATQLVIWYLTGDYTEEGARTAAASIDANYGGGVGYCLEEFDRIITYLDYLDKRPSFAYATKTQAEANPYKMNYNSTTGKYSITLGDTNGVVGNFGTRLFQTVEGITYTQDVNNLTITSDHPITKDEKVDLNLIRKQPVAGQVFTFVSPSRQDMCYGNQNNDPLSAYISLYTDFKGKVTLDKRDAFNMYGKGPIKDCTLMVQEWSVTNNAWVDSQTMTFDETTQKYISDWLYVTSDNEAKFRVIETKGNTIYDINSSYAEEFTIDESDKTYELATLYDQPRSCSLLIPKMDALTGNAIKKDVTFSLYEWSNAQNKYVPYNKGVTIKRTSANSLTYETKGKESFTQTSSLGATSTVYGDEGRLYYTEDNAGKFLVKECLPDGITPGNASGYIGDWISKTNMTDFYQYEIAIVPDNQTTGTADIIRNGVKIGSRFTVHSKGTVTLTRGSDYYNVVNTNGFNNSSTSAKLTITKKDSESGLSKAQGYHSSLVGAEYVLIPSEDIYYADENTLYKAGVEKSTIEDILNQMKIQEALMNNANGLYKDKVASATAEFTRLSNQLKAMAVPSAGKGTPTFATTHLDADNKIVAEFSNIALGNYYLVEVKPSTNYKLSTTITEEEFTYDGPKVPVVMYTEDVVEEVKSQGFELLKVTGEDDEFNPLAGAGFKIYSLDELSKLSASEKTLDDATLLSVVREKYKAETNYDFSEEATTTLYNNGEAYNIPELFTDENGQLQSPELPIGKYIVYESTIPRADLEGIKPFLVSITADGVTVNEASGTFGNVYQPYRVFIDKEITVRLKLVKLDGTTQKPVLKNGATYKIFDLEKNEYVSQKTYYPEEKIWTEFTTDATGYLIMPEDLSGGIYRIEEVQAPDNYVKQGFEAYYDIVTGQIVKNPSAPITFEISNATELTPDEDNARVFIVNINQVNDEVKGVIRVLKTGEVATSTSTSLYEVKKNEVSGLGQDISATNKQFVYETKNIPEATFEVWTKDTIYTADNQLDFDAIKADYPEYADLTANEIIKLNKDFTEYRTIATKENSKGEVITLNANTLVDTIVSNDSGVATLTDLPLGTYIVKETVAPNGFTINKEEKEVTITSKDSETAIVLNDVTYEDKRQTLDVNVTKYDEEDTPLSGAVFGLYAKEDIYSNDGTLLASKDELLETKVTKSDGKIKFDLDAPCGSKFYIKEIAAPIYYEMLDDDDVYNVLFDYAGQDKDVVKINAEFINNQAQGYIKVLKLDEKTRIPLRGVVFEISDSEGKLLETLTTDADGIAKTTNKYNTLTRNATTGVLEPAKYHVKEVSSVPGYYIEEQEFDVVFNTVDVDGTNIAYIEITNRPYRTEISKKSATTGKDIVGALLTIYNEDNQVVASWITDGKPREIDALPLGKYRIVEERTPFGYVIAEEQEFEVINTNEIQKCVMYDEEAQGKLIIDKFDKNTKQVLPGVTFEIRDLNGNVVDTLTTDENGHAESKLLPFATFGSDGSYENIINYILVETKAAEGYVLDSTEFTINFKYIDDKTPIIELRGKIANKKKPSVPKTGDNTPLTLSLIILLGAMAGAGIVLTKKMSLNKNVLVSTSNYRDEYNNSYGAEVREKDLVFGSQAFRDASPLREHKSPLRDNDELAKKKE